VRGENGRWVWLWLGRQGEVCEECGWARQREGFEEWQANDVGVGPVGVSDERAAEALDAIGAGFVHGFAGVDVALDGVVVEVCEVDGGGDDAVVGV